MNTITAKIQDSLKALNILVRKRRKKNIGHHAHRHTIIELGIQQNGMKSVPSLYHLTLVGKDLITVILDSKGQGNAQFSCGIQIINFLNNESISAPLYQKQKLIYTKNLLQYQLLLRMFQWRYSKGNVSIRYAIAMHIAFAPGSNVMNTVELLI